MNRSWNCQVPSWQDWGDSLPEEEKKSRRRERIMKLIREGWFTASQVREIIMAPVTRIVIDEDSKETKDETVPVAEASAEAVPGRVAKAVAEAEAVAEPVAEAEAVQVVDVIKGNSDICAQMFAEKSFGFAIPDDGSDDVFVLYKHNPGLEGINHEGAAVTFDKEWDVGRGKYRGINCKVKGSGGGRKADGDAYLEPEQSNQMVKGCIKRGVALANFYENHDAYKGPRKWR